MARWLVTAVPHHAGDACEPPLDQLRPGSTSDAPAWYHPGWVGLNLHNKNTILHVGRQREHPMLAIWLLRT